MDHNPTPEELAELRALALAQLAAAVQLNRQLAQTSPAERLALLQESQSRLQALQAQYPAETAQFKVLGLAWESIRLAWYLLGQGHDSGKLALVREALAALEEQLNG